MAAERFTGTLESVRGGGAAVVVPFDARAAFREARAPVRGSVNGTPFRTRLMPYGGVTYLGLTKAVREAAGIVPGDAVEVVLERDDAPREVELPPELVTALADPGLRAAYDALAFTHRREYAEWVADAKRPETRARRAAKAAEMVRVSAGLVGGSNT
jgi:bifunctional DNA-binding transcriptional regulator/antitoxin component of YhaV-PrlF toxin-antitoxin module